MEYLSGAVVIIQKKVVRIICSVSHRTNYNKPLVKSLGILTVASLYLMQELLHIRYIV